VGFAAETGSLDRAADKLRRKGVDLLVANDVAEEGSGFGTDTNHVWILDADGSQVDVPLRSKRAVAEEILDRVVRALDGGATAAQTERVTQETGA
jgi:phosphopantothenoylcysteine decarboxylase/phosphopantothenate--cysteine ligase